MAATNRRAKEHPADPADAQERDKAWNDMRGSKHAVIQQTQRTLAVILCGQLPRDVEHMFGRGEHALADDASVNDRIGDTQEVDAGDRHEVVHQARSTSTTQRRMLRSSARRHPSLNSSRAAVPQRRVQVRQSFIRQQPQIGVQPRLSFAQLMLHHAHSNDDKRLR